MGGGTKSRNQECRLREPSAEVKTDVGHVTRVALDRVEL